MIYRFDAFLLDVANRQLTRAGEPVALNARYFDALVLLVREHGRLVEKDRFFEEVWDDVVVSDAALTQCIKDVRRHLGDDAASPRFIRTVPRHGYRFVAPVEVLAEVPAEVLAAPPVSPPVPTAPPPPVAAAAPAAPADGPVEAEVSVAASAAASREGSAGGGRPAGLVQRALAWSLAGALGGAGAGVFGGLLYGFGLAYAPAQSGVGAASVLAVLVALNVLVGLSGGLGISAGMAAAGLVRGRAPGWNVLGAAGGGLAVGTAAKLLGVDAFDLLFGRAPLEMTGGLEGAALGAALALGAWGGTRTGPDAWRPVAGAGLAGAVAGALIPAAGGRLMGGSLELLARSFEGSRLELDALGRYVGELHFGTATQVALGGVEGLLFALGVVGALVAVCRAER